MTSSQCSVCINSSYKPAEQVPTALLQSLFEEVIVIFSELPAVWSLKKEAVVIKAETIRKNELKPQLLPASLTSRKLGQLMSIGGRTS